MGVSCRAGRKQKRVTKETVSDVKESKEASRVVVRRKAMTDDDGGGWRKKEYAGDYGEQISWRRRTRRLVTGKGRSELK